MLLHLRDFRRRVPWTPPGAAWYTPKVLAYAAAAYLTGFLVFLVWISEFMRREERKFGDNQYTMKLLPPPPPKGRTPVENHARAYIGGVPAQVRLGAARPRSILA